MCIGRQHRMRQCVLMECTVQRVCAGVFVFVYVFMTPTACSIDTSKHPQFPCPPFSLRGLDNFLYHLCRNWQFACCVGKLHTVVNGMHSH